MLKLNNENFEKTIAENQVVLVDFWAEWCGPCKMLAPELDAFNEKQANKITVGKVNIDECVNIAIEHKVEVIPTLILFKNGKEVKRSVGLIKAQEIANFVFND